jgi:hypothetical protein
MDLEKNFGPREVAHAIIPATREAEIRTIMVQGQPGQKLVGTISTNKPHVVACVHDPRDHR